MPTFLVLSDIHANLQALEAVFTHVQSTYKRPDAIWCLGDLVGYGPQPGECIDLLRAAPTRFGGAPLYCIKGNHDQGVVNVDQNVKQDGAEQVLKSWQWTAQMLSKEQKDYLAKLPTSHTFDNLPRTVHLVHAAPPDSMDHYMLVAKHVEDMLDACTRQICFFGHTHLACYFECNLDRREARPRLFPLQGQPGPEVEHQSRRFIPTTTPTSVESQAARLFVNPGSVGQPRWGRVVETLPASPYPVAYLGLREATYLWVELEAATVRLWIHYVDYNVTKTLQLLTELRQEQAFEVPERWQHRLRDGLR